MSQQPGPAMLVIGGGAMASAILGGAGASGALPAEVCVVDPNPDKRTEFRLVVASAAEGLAWLRACETRTGRSGVLLLAVKPQMLASVRDELGPAGIGERLVISILAGVPGAVVRRELGGRCRVVRVMPNTPAQIRRGVSAVSSSAGATTEDAAFARALFRGVGDVVIDLAEDQMDAFTGVAGSGPAYVFYLAEAMERAATEIGLPTEHVRAIVTETIAGAAELLRSSGDAPSELRGRVTSKGGTTAAATSVFDESGLTQIVVRAITAARDRGRELGR